MPKKRHQECCFGLLVLHFGVTIWLNNDDYDTLLSSASQVVSYCLMSAIFIDRQEESRMAANTQKGVFG